MPSRNLAEGVPAKSQGRILIVDDEPELTQALREMLARQGYETAGFTDGRQALAALAEQSYDVLLADLMMPEIDGITLLKRALEIDPNLIGMIMTGQGTVQTAVEAMKSGAFDYILKPFKLNTVLASLSRSLEVRRLRTENLQLREMVNIYDLGQTVAARLDTQTILEKTAEAALQQCQADEVSILLPVAEQNELAIVTAYGDERDYLVGQHVPIEGTIAGWVAQHKEPVALHGEVVDERFSAAYPRPDIRSAISMPMVLGKKLVGVLNVNMTHRRQPITQGQIRALSILVSIAAAAMENARLHEQTEARLRRLTALRTIDLAITSSMDLRVTLDIFLDQVAMQLSADAAAIWLLDPLSQSLEYAAGRGFHSDRMQDARIPPGLGYAGEAAIERRLVQEPDLLNVQLKPETEQIIADEGFRALFAAPLVAKGEVEGVLEVFQRAPFSPDPEWIQFLEALTGQAAIAIENSRLFEGLQRSNQQLLLAYNSTIEGWSRALDLRDRETEGHTQRVTEMTLRLARFMEQFDEDQLAQIRRGALLHDIGKMGVPDDILLKPGPLLPGEWEVMRRHPDYAYQLLSPITYLRNALDIPYLHHERWDGSGYPLGLSGRQIPLAARIFAVVDVWDALRSDRPYRKGWPDEQVLSYIQEQAGIHFDPEVVQAFLHVL